jgi:tripartite-type tricarboxylate transporter receptor subunit TctC
MEMLKSAAGLEIQPVTYRGDALPLVEGGQLKALAVAGSKRSPAMANVPTIAETIPGFDSTSWQGYFLPAGTPRDIVVKLQQETAKVLKLPEVIERLRAGGNEGIGSTPEEFDARFRGDIVKFAKIIADAKIPKLD